MAPLGHVRRLAGAAALVGAGGLLYAREVEPRRLEVVRLELNLPRLAAAFALALRSPNTVGKTFELLSGETPIREALERL